ncbi:MAG: peptidoglycan-associated lipoprotein, partial [Deltaproteobacteria bacterium]|nr:peptidoglycan-associated lipoprotein [Deltaproteobacteria bacterium]
KSAYNYLVDNGISGSRLYTVSYGEERPLDPGHNEAAWALNRRAQFVLQ